MKIKWKTMAKSEKIAYSLGIAIGIAGIIAEIIAFYVDSFKNYGWLGHSLIIFAFGYLAIESLIHIAKDSFNLGRKMSKKQRERKHKD